MFHHVASPAWQVGLCVGSRSLISTIELCWEKAGRDGGSWWDGSRWIRSCIHYCAAAEVAVYRTNLSSFLTKPYFTLPYLTFKGQYYCNPFFLLRATEL